MSLTEPSNKMSKSDPNPRSRVAILDEPDVMRKRIRSAVTDSDPEVRYDVEEKPGISNLLDIMSGVTGTPIDALVDEYASSGYGVFKDAVADAVIEELAPFRTTYADLDDAYVRTVLHDSGIAAQALAASYMGGVRRAVGLTEF
jgi:tryptophanyl-tRNA synthetase